MRILYCAPNSSSTRYTDIGIYLTHALDAMAAAGHDVFVFTWSYDCTSSTSIGSVLSSRLRSVVLDRSEVTRAYPAGPPITALSHVLAPHIAACIDHWNIEVIESCDQAFTAYAFYQQARISRKYRDLVLASFQCGLNLHTYRQMLEFPDRAVSDDLCSERQMLRLSDVVISPSHRAANITQGLGVRTKFEVVAPPFRFVDQFASDEFSGRFIHCGVNSIAGGLDSIAFLVNQISGNISLAELYLIGRDAGTKLQCDSAIDLLVKRLKLANSLTLVAAGKQQRVDALDLLHPRDILFAFDESEALNYVPMQALDRGVFPLTSVGSSTAEMFPVEMQDCLLPADLSDRRQVLAICQRILTEKGKMTAALQQAWSKRSDPTAFVARMEGIYGSLRDRKVTTHHSFFAQPLTTPTIAVLIAAYNPPDVFKDTLDCLARQSLHPDRLFICDDGSSHGLEHWLDYANSLGLKPTLLHQHNQGLLGARNTLVDASDADLSVFLDCDDLLADNALERMRDAWMESGRPDAVIPQRANFGESNEKVLRHLLYDHLHFARNEYRMTALVRTAVLQDIRFNAMCRNGEADDWVFWLAFSLRGLRAEFIPEPLFQYRFRTGSMSWPWFEGQSVATASAISALVAKSLPSERLSHLFDWSLFELHASLHDGSRR